MKIRVRILSRTRTCPFSDLCPPLNPGYVIAQKFLSSSSIVKRKIHKKGRAVILDGAGGTRLCHKNKTEEKEGPRNEQQNGQNVREDGVC